MSGDTDEYDYDEAPDVSVEDNTDEDYEAGDIEQHTLISFITSNADFWRKCFPIIEPRYFSSEFQKTVQFIRDFYISHKRLPPLPIVRAETGVLLETHNEASDKKIQGYLQEKVEEFCRLEATRLLMLETYDKMSDSTPSAEVVAQHYIECKRIAGIAMSRELGFEVHRDMKKMLKLGEEVDGLPTGFPLLDEELGGGVTLPSFNLASGGSGDGKSIFMQNLCVNQARMGNNCVFYSLELQPEIIFKRFGAMMTETDIGSIYHNKDLVHAKMVSMGRSEGKIMVIKMPMSGTTVADIAAHHADLCEDTGMNWSFVCVDYIDVMSSIQTVSAENIHLKDKYVAEELNDFTHESKIICWSASQQVKGAQEEKEARQSAVSGGTPKVSTCDNLIILKRSPEDREEERSWGIVKKARSSGAMNAKIPFHWDNKTQRMTSGDRELYLEANSKQSAMNSGDMPRLSNDPIVKHVKEQSTGTEPEDPQDVRDKLKRRFGRRRDE